MTDSTTTDQIARDSIQAALSLHPMNSESSLAEISDEGLLALTFIRHSGCTFCRDTLQRLANERTTLEGQGLRLGIVGMSEPEVLKDLMVKFGLQDLLLVSDPERKLYKALEIPRGNVFQVLGPSQLWYAMRSGAFKRFGVGKIDADPFQLGGAIILFKREIVASHRASSASEVCEIGPLAAQMAAKQA